MLRRGIIPARLYPWDVFSSINGGDATMEDPARIQAEFRRRMMWGVGIATAAILIGIVGIPLLKGQHYSPLVILLTLAITVPPMAFSFWLVKRLGGFDAKLYAEQRRQPGETRWQWYRRNYTAEPRRRPIYRMYMVIGLIVAVTSFVSLHNNTWQFIGNLLLGCGFLLMGGAEYQPYGQRQRAKIMRIAAAVVLLVAMPFVWGSIFRS